jgi:transposase
METAAEKLGRMYSEVLFCFEDTGRYSKRLSVFLSSSGLLFSRLNALDVKRSMGLRRGKTDKRDSEMIARYASQRLEELVCTQLGGPVMDQLHVLLSLREKLIKHRTAYKNGLQDLYDCYCEGEFDFIRERQGSMVIHLDKEIGLVEQRIYGLIDRHESLRTNYRLLHSVRCIGKVLAAYMIVLTENFTRFSTARKFACYAGIAPFEHSSGSSIRGRTRVHACANKQIKTLLNMAALSSIQIKGEFREYYERRISEGKHKMSTLNIIRNKIVFRAFAVVQRGTPYVDLHKFVA